MEEKRQVERVMRTVYCWFTVAQSPSSCSQQSWDVATVGEGGDWDQSGNLSQDLTTLCWGGEE